MKTKQFQELIQHVTGRPLTFSEYEEIPLDQIICVYRPYKLGVNVLPSTVLSFEWKTPKKEDSLLRSFITAFCSKYKEPDPDTYDRNCSCYGDTWIKHEEKWNNPETHWNCSLWNHHTSHMVSKDKLKKQIIENFSKFNAATARLGFYETHYGIGIFTIYGGAWVDSCLNSMSQHLKACNIPYRNELSDAGWVTRFVINLTKEIHGEILKDFK
jgi:hypothetical protein